MQGRDKCSAWNPCMTHASSVYSEEKTHVFPFLFPFLFFLSSNTHFFGLFPLSISITHEVHDIIMAKIPFDNVLVPGGSSSAPNLPQLENNSNGSAAINRSFLTSASSLNSRGFARSRTSDDVRSIRHNPLRASSPTMSFSARQISMASPALSTRYPQQQIPQQMSMAEHVQQFQQYLQQQQQQHQYLQRTNQHQPMSQQQNHSYQPQQQPQQQYQHQHLPEDQQQLQLNHHQLHQQQRDPQQHLQYQGHQQERQLLLLQQFSSSTDRTPPLQTMESPAMSSDIELFSPPAPRPISLSRDSSVSDLTSIVSTPVSKSAEIRPWEYYFNIPFGELPDPEICNHYGHQLLADLPVRKLFNAVAYPDATYQHFFKTELPPNMEGEIDDNWAYCHLPILGPDNEWTICGEKRKRHVGNKSQKTHIADHAQHSKSLDQFRVNQKARTAGKGKHSDFAY